MDRPGGRWPPLAQAGAMVLAIVVLAACSPRQMVVRNVADELAAQGQSAEDDLDLAREASAFYLKLSESVLRQQPGHAALAQAVAGGFTQYAYAFVAFEADKLEATDAKGAQRLRERAAKLYRRAQRHAMAALEAGSPGFSQALASAESASWPKLRRDQVGLAYWAAAAWGGMISLSKDDPDVVADLPLAVRLAHLAWEADPDYGQGSLASLMGTFEAARPGGSRTQALAYFDRAIALSDGRNAGAYVAKAEGIAQPAGERAQFEALLHEALAIKDEPGSTLALQNEVMRRRAQWLLDTADELF
ncbi:MAG: hypothetical protein HGA47_14335 [Zoogloea sp.]|nr:hypothetical protein [Zoogloea sp.]